METFRKDSGGRVKSFSNRKSEEMKSHKKWIKIHSRFGMILRMIQKFTQKRNYFLRNHLRG